MTDMITAGRTELFASPPGPEHNTFTIIGRCERTGMLGICTTTRSLSVGSRVTHGRARVGVIAFQAVADPRMGYLAMRLFDLGYSAPKVVRELQDSDPHAEMRQIAAIDGDGNIAAVTGSNTRPWTGHQARKHHVAMGNVLTSERTVTSMTERFEATVAMPLEDRLMLAIEAGRDAGGQIGGQVSAALLVFDTQPFPHVDLRVDAHDEPVGELRRVFEVYRPFIPYYNQRASNPAIAPRTDWLDAQQGQGSAAR
jgi:uncharacterized Ntn-hydrolase superfamily protein